MQRKFQPVSCLRKRLEFNAVAKIAAIDGWVVIFRIYHERNIVNMHFDFKQKKSAPFRAMAGGARRMA
jgi:hypothetical protein